VSHHPSISAAHCESANFVLWQGMSSLISVSSGRCTLQTFHVTKCVLYCVVYVL